MAGWPDWVARFVDAAWTAGVGMAVAAAAALAVHWLLPKRPWHGLPALPEELRLALRRPLLRAFAPVAGLLAVAAGATPAVADSLRHAALLLAILGLAWLLLNLARVARERVERRHPLDVADNLAARTVHTQLRVLAQVVRIAVLVLAVAAGLMTFPAVRHVGAGLLASAGLAGLAVALAVKPVLSNVIAGLQIALAQPIRIDDVVVVEGHWGRIEEIATTHVVVKVWDERRLVLPLTWFLEKPFENWTRSSAQMLGTVLLWTDPGAPVDVLRAKLHALCRDDPDWDGRVAQVQVVETSERAMQVRALVSAADAGRLWSLRCRVREGLLAFIAREHACALPRVRTDPGGAHAAAAVE
jgi:small-conductance mechanosensitive channel